MTGKSGGGDGPDKDVSVPDPVDISTPLARQRVRLHGGGGAGEDGPSLEARVARLEVFMEVSREDLHEIKTDVKAVIAKLGGLTSLPTRTELNSWKIQWFAGGVALFAVILGSIIGGLAWLAEIAS